MAKKKKKMPSKPFVTDAYRMLPLSGLSRAVLGESAEDFETVMDRSFMQQCMQEFVNKHHIGSLSWSITYWSEVRVLCFDLEY